MHAVAFALGVIELASVFLFTLDYIARALSAAASRSGGLMRYLLSFYGLVDLLSVLPFFLGLPTFGGIASISPKLLPTLVRRYVGGMAVDEDRAVGASVCAFEGRHGVIFFIHEDGKVLYKRS